MKENIGYHKLAVFPKNLCKFNQNQMPPRGFLQDLWRVFEAFSIVWEMHP